MDSDVHLTLKSVGPEAIEVAREAARRCGLSLGQWLNAVIMDSAVSYTHLTLPTNREV